jgi:hypothetical protein
MAYMTLSQIYYFLHSGKKEPRIQNIPYVLDLQQRQIITLKAAFDSNFDKRSDYSSAQIAAGKA